MSSAYVAAMTRRIEEREARERAEMFQGLYEENEEAFWKLIKFEAEHEQDRLDYFDEVDKAERKRKRDEWRRRAEEVGELSPGALSLPDALERLENVRLVGDLKWRAKCPVHGGHSQPLMVTPLEAYPGAPFFHCFAGCDWREIKAALL